jgi:hypothetical protein
LVSPRMYNPLNFQTLSVFGSRVASAVTLTLVVAVLPRFNVRPNPALPVHRGGGPGGGG